MDKEVELVRKRTNSEEKKNKRSFFAVLFSRRKGSRLGLLLFALFVTVVMLSTATYAWFTSNYTVSINTISINVSSGAGITISTNAVDWKAVLTNEDITTNAYNGNMNYIPSSDVNPVSTDGTLDTNNRFTFYQGQIVADTHSGVYYLDTSVISEGSTDAKTISNYVVFDMFIKSDFSTAQNIYFTKGTGVTAGSTNKYIQYSTRFAIIPLGNTSATSGASTMIALNTLETNPGVKIYEPYWDVHTANGITNASDTYKLFSGTASTPYLQTGNTGSVPYFGIKASTTHTDGTSGASDTGVTLENSYGSTAAATAITGTTAVSTVPTLFSNAELISANGIGQYSSNYMYMSLPVGVSKFRVYVWVEGQDIDCENNASGGNFAFNLGFEVNNASSTSAS